MWLRGILFNLSKCADTFSCICSRQLLKTVWPKEEWLIIMLSFIEIFPIFMLICFQRCSLQIFTMQASDNRRQVSVYTMELNSFLSCFQFVLKHEKFGSLCEVPGYPSALCPSNSGNILS